MSQSKAVDLVQVDLSSDQGLLDAGVDLSSRSARAGQSLLWVIVDSLGYMARNFPEHLYRLAGGTFVAVAYAAVCVEVECGECRASVCIYHADRARCPKLRGLADGAGPGADLFHLANSAGSSLVQ